MARNCIISLMSIIIALAFGSMGSATDLSDCDRNGAPRTTAAAAKKKSACTELSPARKAAAVSIDPETPNTGNGPAEMSAIERLDHFVVLRRQPQRASADTLVLLHGSGGDEATLMDFASRIDPRAVLMGVRGRLVQDGVTRWYRRLTPTRFDQDDIRSEAGAFAAFLRQAAGADKLDLAHTTFIGYSNGANLLIAMALLHPDIVERAVLLRPMSVLESIPEVDLSGARFLTVAGAADSIYAPFAPALEAMLRRHGAQVDARTIKSDHAFGDEDIRTVSEWLGASNAVSMNQ